MRIFLASEVRADSSIGKDAWGKKLCACLDLDSKISFSRHPV